MSIVCRLKVAVVVVLLLSFLTGSQVLASDGEASTISRNQEVVGPAGSLTPSNPGSAEPLLARILPTATALNDFLVKVAYGRTFGTSTELDYATLELSKSVTKRPMNTSYGPALGELQIAMLASYVFYYEGTIERIKRLNFRDGYELAWLPKGRVSLSQGLLGMVPYVETGAGIGYVSETYRNSGSRFNWSLLGGMGFERRVADVAVLSVGLQWRHLSNGNMWGKGDELHNSNSGTDMLQGLATLVHRF